MSSSTLVQIQQAILLLYFTYFHYTPYRKAYSYITKYNSSFVDRSIIYIFAPGNSFCYPSCIKSDHLIPPVSLRFSHRYCIFPLLQSTHTIPNPICILLQITDTMFAVHHIFFFFLNQLHTANINYYLTFDEVSFYKFSTAIQYSVIKIEILVSKLVTSLSSDTSAVNVCQW